LPQTFVTNERKTDTQHFSTSATSRLKNHRRENGQTDGQTGKVVVCEFVTA